MDVKAFTTSGEPTFGIPKNTTAMVMDKKGTTLVSFHDGDTWWEGHYDSSGKTTKIQLKFPPVKLAPPFDEAAA